MGRLHQDLREVVQERFESDPGVPYPVFAFCVL